MDVPFRSRSITTSATAALRKQILFDVSTEIRAGEIVIVTGPSGSGKTTLLTLIGALRRVQEGSVQVLGERAERRAQRASSAGCASSIGYIFQAHNLLDCADRDAERADGAPPAPRSVARRDPAARRRDARGRRPRRARCDYFPEPALRAGRSSASPSRARWPASRASFSPTSRPRRSTSSPGATSSTLMHDLAKQQGVDRAAGHARQPHPRRRRPHHPPRGRPPVVVHRRGHRQHAAHDGHARAAQPQGRAGAPGGRAVGASSSRARSTRRRRSASSFCASSR